MRINKLERLLNYEELTKKYDFFVVRTSDKYFKTSAGILDLQLPDKNVCSIKYESGNSFFIMMRHNEKNCYDLKKAVNQYPESTKVSFSQVIPQNLEAHILLQLLLNSIVWTSNPYLNFNNLTGKLYCFHKLNIVRFTSKEKSYLKQIKALEIFVDKKLCLQLNVRTFTNIKFKDQLDFGKKKIEEFPQYVMSLKGSLKRAAETDSGDHFVLRQFRNAKSEIQFLSIQDKDQFEASKMGILYTVQALFNKQHQGVATIKFEEREYDQAIDHQKKEDKRLKGVITELLNQTGVQIVDKVGTEQSKNLIANMQNHFSAQYDVKVPCRKVFSKQHLNIALIHNKEWYEGKADKHSTTGDYALQHITIENFVFKSSFAVKTIVNELIIKHDLCENKLSICDWQSFKFKTNWIFGTRVEIEKRIRYFFMTIHPDGSFEIAEKKLDLFSMDEYNKYVGIMDERDVSGVVINERKEINVIKNTGCYMIPEIEAIHEYLDRGNNKLRSKEKREELLSACLDIKYVITSENTAEYFVGAIGEGMQSKISDACLIRKVQSYEDSPLFFDELLPLMDVVFVRNGQLTVIPFPHKYLREWIKMKIGGSYE